MRYLGPDPCPHRRVHWSAPAIVADADRNDPDAHQRPRDAVARMKGTCRDCGLSLQRRTPRLVYGPPEVIESPRPPTPHDQNAA